MNDAFPRASIILSTYNQPNVLRLVLLALAEQNTGNFEVIIADDGSSNDTKKTIESLKPQINYSVRHVWQQHNGFRAAMIRNKSAVFATGEYLIFLDGDSIPPISFVSRHQKLAESNYFVSSNRVLLSSSFTNQVLKQQLPVQRWKIWQWLYAFCCGWINRFLPVLSLGDLYLRYMCCTKWQGAKTCNLGVWKKDFFTVNGFDESYCGWGYEDSDLVVRLIHSGVLRKDGRFAVPVFHMWHTVNSRNQERDNYRKLEETIHSSRIKAGCGVDQYTHEL